MIKKCFITVTLLVSVGVATAQEYMDLQTKVVYTYEPGSGIAVVKAGREYARGEEEEELEWITESGSPEASGEVSILSSFVVDNQEYAVTKICDIAFYGCWDVTSVTMPLSLTAIGEFAFWYCANLNRIEISKNVTSIGRCAFGLCDLATIISHIEEPFDTEAFKNVNIANVTLYVPKGTAVKYKMAQGWNTFPNIVEMDVTDIQPLARHQDLYQVTFDLQGHRLITPLRHGLYIKNKRKHVR